MNDFVWLSHAPSDPTLADGFTKSDLQREGDEKAIELSKVARKGGVVAQSDLPTEIWGEVGAYRTHHFPDYWPDISYYGGIWVVSSAVARILRGFELGGGVIAPVRLFEKDHVALVTGEWFCWNVGNAKEAFVPERSQHIRPAPGRTWRTLQAVDHDLKCRATAKTGPDVWFDAALKGVLFLGHGLGQALIDADFANEKAGLGKLMKVDIIED